MHYVFRNQDFCDVVKWYTNGDIDRHFSSLFDCIRLSYKVVNSGIGAAKIIANSLIA